MANPEIRQIADEDTRRPNRSTVRSCLECRRRKIRCDRKQPCAYCVKVRIQCTYPTVQQHSEHEPRNSKLDVESKLLQMAAHVQRLEERVAFLEGRQSCNVSANSPSEKSRQSHMPVRESMPSNVDGNVSLTVPQAREIQSKASENVNEQQNAASDSFQAQSDVTVQGRADADHRQVSLVSGFSDGSHLIGDSESDKVIRTASAQQMSRYNPPQNEALILWRLFKENVDPVLKLFHIPALERQVFEAVHRPENLEPEFESLLFAVYYAAVVSTEDGDWHRLALGPNRDRVLQHYQSCCQSAMARANILRTSNTIALQALTLFLSCGRRYLDSDYVWSMAGVAVRTAIKVGLHRESDIRDFPPFISQMRRRLWSMIVVLETRSAEDSGQDSTLYEQQFDTKFPLNINDSDLDPEVYTAPVEGTGHTDIMPSLIRFQINAVARRIVFSTKFSTDNGYKEVTAAEKSELLDETWLDLQDRYFRHCDPQVPICFFNMATARLVLARLKLGLYHPRRQRQDRLQCRDGNAFQVLVSTSIEVMERAHMLRSDERYRRWFWLTQKYIEWDAAAFVLISLSRPSHSLKNHQELQARAWHVIDKFFDSWGEHVDSAKEMSWTRLIQLKIQAQNRSKEDLLVHDTARARESSLPARSPSRPDEAQESWEEIERAIESGTFTFGMDVDNQATNPWF